ncbi:polysaccharide pyruvyl transferase family protein [Microbacterium protaetiae]|uniref:Polysaccharide pyruvyl transferase family protein n=1 Tax=Microbacterium protaetiae TaxID=2509458 RepID=A0A4P6EKF5_9MICO|nr:polysaccharide pyruvyl transferase family protein [Microbacterium protaetiae]QAY60627.1 polysaccharide pyruvyl transferase family protein [Microbacterium protaetiae]
MKYVVLGDVGLRSLYHVGDEAMMDVAVDMISAQPDAQITLVVGDPLTATSHYGVPAVKRIGFSPRWTWRQSAERLARETSDQMLAAPARGSVAEAVRNSEVVVIAGGGNMTSRYAHHLYERVAITRMARYFDKPLLVTSQTVGPVLRPRDAELLAEIVGYASYFGARDDDSFALLRALVPDRDAGRSDQVVYRTADDAVLLCAGETARAELVGMELPPRYVVASFTSDPGTTGIAQDEYTAAIADTLTRLSDALDAHVLLLPHTGALEGRPVGDQITDDAVVAAADTARIRALPVMTARAAAAVTAGAVLSVSTRYHAAVFAVAAAVPAVAVSLSYYSSVRFRGAMVPAGLEPYIVPATAWDQIVPACVHAVGRGDTTRTTLQGYAASQRDYQRAWWVTLKGAASGHDAAPVPAFPRRYTTQIDEPWAAAVRASFVAFDAQAREQNRTEWLQRDVDVLESASAAAEARLALEQKATHAAQRVVDELRRRVQALESRKAVRFADRVARLQQRMRTAFRSRARVKRTGH